MTFKRTLASVVNCSKSTADSYKPQVGEKVALPQNIGVKIMLLCGSSCVDILACTYVPC